MNTGSMADMAFRLRVATPHLTGPEHRHSLGSAGLRHPAKPTRKFPEHFPMRHGWLFLFQSQHL